MKKSVLIPVIVGAAAAGALAYFLLSDDAEELRNEMARLIDKAVDNLKDKLKDNIVPVGDRVAENS